MQCSFRYCQADVKEYTSRSFKFGIVGGGLDISLQAGIKMTKIRFKDDLQTFQNGFPLYFDVPHYCNYVATEPYLQMKLFLCQGALPQSYCCGLLL